MTHAWADRARRPTDAVPTGAVPPQEAVIFDMDGVVTDTASVHAAAWARLFDEVLNDPRLSGAGPYPPFDAVTDYRRYVDGRAREDGVSAFLEARGIALPVGDQSDLADAWTVHGLAARKNSLYLEALARAGVRVFPGTVDLVRRLKAGGVRAALVTASRNASVLLAEADLAGLFDVVVDGQVAAEIGLAGKPDPAMFLKAAQLLGVDPARAAVVEDATAGVESARRGGFGLVVGIDRGEQREALLAAGAHIVLGDVSQLDLGALRADPWALVYEGFDPAHEGHREALITLGNGYMGTRGAAPESSADGVHYPGTYLAGVYNRITSNVHGRAMEDESLINVPNWLVLDVRVGQAEWWSSGGLTTTWERRELDLRRGLLTRRAVLTDSLGRRLRLTQRRLVSMARPHVAALETTLVAEGWNGPVSIRCGVDAGITNGNVAEYRGLADRHLRTVVAEVTEQGTIVVEVETTQSQVRIAMGARVRLTGTGTPVAAGVEQEGGRTMHRIDLVLLDGEPATVDKTVAVVTSRDAAFASPRLGALEQLGATQGGFDALLAEHQDAWARLWARFAVRLDSDSQTQLVLNLHAFHLLQSVSPHTADVDAGVPARGLHGEGYRGHVFWDELFVLPVLTARLPWVGRALLEYRFRRLPAARRAATQAGYAGAMFPWQSGSDGREETPSDLFNTRSGRWIPDNSRRQRHVGLAVAYNAWTYYQATGDVAWLAHRGADLIIEVARFFTSLATYDADQDRFHLSGVMGPDEYHDGYPDGRGQGLRDNAYTNVLASWVCGRAVDVLALTSGHDCENLRDRLRIGAGEAARWEQLSRRLAVPFHSDGIISQFDGYADLIELDWGRYRRTYGNIGRLDLILDAEGDSTNRYKLAKQADVLMLVYLLGPEGLVATLDRLGYPLAPDVLPRTVDYYLMRTAHGSTLSRVVHTSVLARMDPARAWQNFQEALAADLDDTQGGTTSEGVHLGAMAGTLDIVARAFAGLRTQDDTVILDPRLPTGLRRAEFNVQHRGQRLHVSLDHDSVTVEADHCAANPLVRVRVGGGSAVTMTGGQCQTFRHQRAAPPRHAGAEWNPVEPQDQPGRGPSCP